MNIFISVLIGAYIISTCIAAFGMVFAFLEYRAINKKHTFCAFLAIFFPIFNSFVAGVVMYSLVEMYNVRKLYKKQ